MSNYTFLSAPSIKMRRNKFTPKYNHDTTMNVGRLYPLYCQEVIPGETISIDVRSVLRSTSSFIKPLLSPLYLDSWFFFVPYRQVCDNFTKLFGEGSPNDWERTPNNLTLPVFSNESYSTDLTGTVCDYLGQLNGKSKAFGNLLHPRAFAKIYNEWFRDENLIDPMLINTSASQVMFEIPNDAEWSPNNYVGKLPKVAKYHDYFTSSLPNTQKGTAVTIPVLANTATAPIVASGDAYSYGNQIQFLTPGSSHGAGFMPLGLKWDTTASTQGGLDWASVSYSDATASNVGVWGANLYADISQVMSQASINDLRFGFQLQRVLERLARSGSRYTEFIQSFFGVTNPDARLQRTEFLGGSHTPINLLQVAQTSQTTETNALGELGAYSWTNTQNKWSKSFTEYGCVIGVFAIRYPHTYSQGVERFLTRKKMTDFYNPVFANLSEQPIFQDELYTAGDESIYSDENRTVFGFQEAWSDIRTRKNRVSGQLNPRATNTLAVWGLYDYYANAPVLSQEFVEENVVSLDDKLAVPSSSLDSFIISVLFDQSIIVPMPLYSEPGLVDHH